MSELKSMEKCIDFKSPHIAFQIKCMLTYKLI